MFCPQHLMARRSLLFADSCNTHHVPDMTGMSLVPWQGDGQQLEVPEWLELANGCLCCSMKVSQPLAFIAHSISIRVSCDHPLVTTNVRLSAVGNCHHVTSCRTSTCISPALP